MIVEMTGEILGEAVRRYPVYRDGSADTNPPDADYAIKTAVSQATRSFVPVRIIGRREEIGRVYLVVGTVEYKMTYKLRAWLDYYHERQANVMPNRILLDYKRGEADLMPYLSTRKRERRRDLIQRTVAAQELTERDQEILTREHFERVNSGYYR